MFNIPLTRNAHGRHPALRAFAMAFLVAMLLNAFIAYGQEGETITVTHAQGETVVPVNPETVLVFDLATLSTLHTLGIPVAGVPDTNYLGSLSEYAGEEYTKIGSLFEPDYELVNALEPDLIIVAARSAAVYPQLSEIAPTIDLSADWSNFLETQYANAQIIGQIFDKEEEVEALWGEIEANVETVKTLTADAGTALIVMTTGGEVTAAGLGSRFGWLHSDLGFAPVIEDIETATHGEAISFEFILEANPDWLIVVDCDSAVGEEAEAAEQILDNELVAQTTAWKRNQVIYLAPVNWYRVIGGLGAIDEMVKDIWYGLDPDAAALVATPEATPEASS